MHILTLKRTNVPRHASFFNGASLGAENAQEDRRGLF
jgi:hypothetical protein